MTTAIAGQPVEEPDDVAAALVDRRPGDAVEVTVLRGGARQTERVSLGTRPATVR